MDHSLTDVYHEAEAVQIGQTRDQKPYLRTNIFASYLEKSESEQQVKFVDESMFSAFMCISVTLNSVRVLITIISWKGSNIC